MESSNQKVKRRDIKQSTIIAILFSALLFIGLLVCSICDFAISNQFTWSNMTTSSILFAWLVFIPIIKWGKRGIATSLTSFSIFIIPYLYVWSVLIKEKSVFSIGAVMSFIAIAYMWCVFGTFMKFETRKRKAIGITFLLAIPFSFIINLALSKMISEPMIDVWDILLVAIFLILASIFFMWDKKSKKL